MQELAEWQKGQCAGCYFADAKKVGTGKPCCTYWGHIEVINEVCKTKREVRSYKCRRGRA